MPDEFALIKSLFVPLSKGNRAAHDLTDDAASLSPPAGKKLVVSTDGFVEGVHFRSNDPASAIGEKILRAALSDLAAMGAKPHHWFLTAAFGSRMSYDRIKQFASGCGKAQRRYGLRLAGGDTIAKTGRSVFSVTVIGSAARPLLRSTAKRHDRLYITGTLGDAALGLRFPKNRFLANRYLYPQPRLAFAAFLPKIASAAIDVSDGLIADLGHMCAASKLGAVVETTRLPISREAKRMSDHWQRLALNAGDDYELLIAASPRNEKRLFAAAERSGTALTYIGWLHTDNRKVVAFDKNEKIVKPLKAGFLHRL